MFNNPNNTNNTTRSFINNIANVMTLGLAVYAVVDLTGKGLNWYLNYNKYPTRRCKSFTTNDNGIIDAGPTIDNVLAESPDDSDDNDESNNQPVILIANQN